MISFRKPSSEQIQAFLATQAGADFSYPGVGSTAAETPIPGFNADRTRVLLGKGDAVFERAKEAVQHWEHFALGWTEACWPAALPHAGQSGAVLARNSGCWWLNACRIVYVRDEPPSRYAFAYGTLPHHVEKGEERFLIEMDPAGNVCYEILAYSRPNHLLAWLGYPYVRLLQRRFRNQSAAVMQQVCAAVASVC